MPDYPPPPPEGTGVVLITLSTGLQIEAECIAGAWWAHLNDNAQAAPLDSAYVTTWQPLG